MQRIFVLSGIENSGKRRFLYRMFFLGRRIAQIDGRICIIQNIDDKKSSKYKDKYTKYYGFPFLFKI